MSGTYISAQLRRLVIERAGNCCEYCRIAQSDQFFAYAIDHIIAEKHGGESVSDNLCLACPDCNSFKGSDFASLDREQGNAVTSLFHPRRDVWDDHFYFDALTGRVNALTASGRVTIFLLRLCDPDRMTDRKLLIDAQRYPCASGI